MTLKICMHCERFVCPREIQNSNNCLFVFYRQGLLSMQNPARPISIPVTHSWSNSHSPVSKANVKNHDMLKMYKHFKLLRIL